SQISVQVQAIMLIRTALLGSLGLLFFLGCSVKEAGRRTVKKKTSYDNFIQPRASRHARIQQPVNA
ncbi:hypothetical protein, partial [Vibrio atlanticus]|uniref:hypothetical protein n=1 Tax=Vibrio atlanticus TaxID=693153 RepID=UPI003551CA57